MFTLTGQCFFLLLLSPSFHIFFLLLLLLCYTHIHPALFSLFPANNFWREQSERGGGYNESYFLFKEKRNRKRIFFSSPPLSLCYKLKMMPKRPMERNEPIGEGRLIALVT